MNFEYQYPTNDQLTPEQRQILGKYLVELLRFNDQRIKKTVGWRIRVNAHLIKARALPLLPLNRTDCTHPELWNEIKRVSDLLSRKTAYKYSNEEN